MLLRIFNIIKKFNPVLVIGIALFFIPFFWFSSEAMDLGGDGTRLYFYDPVAFIKNVSLYSTAPEGKANIDPARHAYLPYVSLFALLKFIPISSANLINIFNGIKLSVGFISIYFIVKELNQKGGRLPAVLSGIFYVLATGSEKLIFHWVKALHSHDQIFLNPLMFLLLLRFLLTQNRLYLWALLFISFIFSTNFAMISSPPFFAFYPLAFLFLLLYVIFIRKIHISLEELLFGLFLFLGIHAFHLIPEILAVVHNDTAATSVVFKESGANYFMAIRGLGLAVVNLFIPSPDPSMRWTSFVAPLVIILGYFLSPKKGKEFLLTSVFFLFTFFLVTANITNIGITFYRSLFVIPGFSMFRNFYLQWAYVFIFFYALLFGQSLAAIFKRLNLKLIQLTGVSMIAIFIIGFWPFLSGQLIDGVNWGSRGVKTAMIMDPRFEQTLDFIRTLPDEGKILVLPLTDNYIQVLYGMNNAAYAGPSSISFLTSKKSFAGYQNFWPDPIPEEIMRYSREKNYDALAQIFSLFNIRYIFHNTDPRIYEEKFPNFPNSYMMTSLPKTQKEYEEFVQKFPVRLLYNNGPYEIYEFDNKIYRSEAYIPDSLYKGDMLKALSDEKISFQSAFLDEETCLLNKTITAFCNSLYISPDAVVEINKINPTRYIIHIQQSGTSPFLLVFQNSYHQDWKLSIDQNQPLGEDKHVLVNKYANGWIISHDDRKGKSDYSISLDLVTQRYFWYGLWITGAFLAILVILVIQSVISKKYNEKN